jgi:TonB family protein
MSARAPIRDWNGPSRRRVPRFQTQAPLDVTVLRSGVPDTVPGRSVNLCERGLAAMIAGELVPGEAVGIEMRLSPEAESLRAKATVRYHDSLRCGLEFVNLSAEQRAAIRGWAKDSKASVETGVRPTVPVAKAAASTKTGAEKIERGNPRKPRQRRRLARWAILAWTIFTAIASIAIVLFFWRWNRSWEELESGLRSRGVIADEKPQARVPTEVMQKLLVHRVEPAYPAEARKENLQGIIALDIVVGRNGSVVSTRALNGPDVLARAAVDALRWWKFEPYRVNGEPEAVETTMAVEFKR